ncbi:restriction endonuclease subunit S [Streptomyces sp. NPDC048002]|uniref:restriction endonuclease subunit S n=1 Tax=Streptomyces sp. NPDC048002 TaxID=3154344 RepID=UPI0033EDEAC8
MTWPTIPLRRLVVCLDGRRIPLNREERSDMQGDVPYWGAGGILDSVSAAIFNEPLVLLGEDGAPFFTTGKDVAYYIEGPSWINNHIHALRPTSVDGRFLAYALNSVDYANYITGATRDKLTQDDLKQIMVWNPPMEEQHRIANFLDVETSRIERLVTQRHQQMKLLAERRTSALAECVSSSGPDSVQHPLVGIVPRSWPVLPLRRVIPAVNVGVVINPSTYFEDDGVPFIHGFNVRSGWIDPRGLKFMSSDSNEELRRSRVHSGDVLVVRAGSPGRAAVVTDEYDGANCASVLILRRGQAMLPHFLTAFINSPAGQGQVQLSQYGAAQEVISAAQTLSFVAPVPDLAEQRYRVDRLNSALEAQARVLRTLEHQVALLAERRQALITAAVSGQLDVSTASGRNITEGVFA